MRNQGKIVPIFERLKIIDEVMFTSMGRTQPQMFEIFLTPQNQELGQNEMF